MKGRHVARPFRRAKDNVEILMLIPFENLHPRWANFFCKKADSNCVRLCRLHGLHHDSTWLMECESSQRHRHWARFGWRVVLFASHWLNEMDKYLEKCKFPTLTQEKRSRKSYTVAYMWKKNQFIIFKMFLKENSRPRWQYQWFLSWTLS